MTSFKKVLIFTLFISVNSPFVQASTVLSDSIGIRTINQKAYIIHKVEKGETLYALSRKYNVDVRSIIAANPGSDNGINVGQEIMVPANNAVIVPQEQNTITHTVTSGESLYMIGRKYDVPINDIKRWNNLRSNALSIGQRLTIHLSPVKAAEINQQKEVMETHGKKIHIVNKGETLFSIARQYNHSVSDLKEWNRLESNTISIGQELIIGYLDAGNQQPVIVQDLEVEEEKPVDVQVSTIPETPSEMTKAEPAGEFKKVSEKGMAQVIEGSESTKKYLALHRNAPIGTIMQVRNEMNDLSVFVRVIGTIPETDLNRNVLIKVSQVAYDRLGAIDAQFPVEVTYHP